MIKRLKCRITGRVQMVMFRDFTRRNARRLDLAGTVQNISDGSVHVIAKGEEEKLEQFSLLLHKGSVFSRVDNVESRWEESTEEFTTFNIIYKNIWDRI